MRTFDGSPRSPRKMGAHLIVGRSSAGGLVLDVVEYGAKGGKVEAGVLLTDEVRRELIRHLVGVPAEVPTL